MVSLLLFLLSVGWLVCFLAVPIACGSFWARDGAGATAMAQATAVTMPDL